MSYRPDNQSLEKPIEKLLEAIEEFFPPATERQRDASEWSGSHRQELKDLCVRLSILKYDLVTLHEGTW